MWRFYAAEWGDDRWAVLGFRVGESPSWLFKGEWFLVRSSIPFFTMSLSDQHPYAMFVAGGLRSPSLAKARVEVGDNADAY